MRGAANLSRPLWRIVRTNENLGRIGRYISGPMWEGQRFNFRRRGYMSNYLNDDYIPN